MAGKPEKSHHDVATCVNELPLASAALRTFYTDPSNTCVLCLGNGSHFISKGDFLFDFLSPYLLRTTWSNDTLQHDFLSTGFVWTIIS